MLGVSPNNTAISNMLRIPPSLTSLRIFFTVSRACGSTASSVEAGILSGSTMRSGEGEGMIWFIDCTAWNVLLSDDVVKVSIVLITRRVVGRQCNNM